MGGGGGQDVTIREGLSLLGGLVFLRGGGGVRTLEDTMVGIKCSCS